MLHRSSSKPPGKWYKPMKIAIDISMAVGESAGVGTYTRGLIEGLARVDAENEYLLYSYLDVPESSWLDSSVSNQISPSAPCKVDGDHWERLWFDAELPPKEALEEVDIIHSPFFNAPKEHHGALVVTIYDLSFLLYPQFHTEANRLHCLNGTLKAALYADRIIAISQSDQTRPHALLFGVGRTHSRRLSGTEALLLSGAQLAISCGAPWTALESTTILSSSLGLSSREKT